MTCILFSCFAWMPRSAYSAWEVGDPIVTYYAGPGWDADNCFMTASNAAQIASGGWNWAWTSKPVDLELAHSNGMRAMWMGAKDDATISAISKYPALYAYFVRDEPAASEFAALAVTVARLKALDPERLAFINLLPTYATPSQLGTSDYATYLDQYLNTVHPDMLSYDNYQFEASGDHPDYFKNLAIVSHYAKRAGIPFINIIQACTWSSSHRVPNGDQRRYLCYTSLAYGAAGISDFVYYHEGFTGMMIDAAGKPTALYNAAKVINPEFLALARAVKPLRHIGAYHLGDLPPGFGTTDGSSPWRLPGDSPFVLSPTIANTTYVDRQPVRGAILGLYGFEPQYTTATHAMVVNLSYSTSLVTRVEGVGNLSVFNPTNCTWVAKGQTYADVTLPPGGCVLVALSEALLPLRGTITSPEDGRNYFTNTAIYATATVITGAPPFTISFYTNSAGGDFGLAGAVTTAPYTVSLGPLAPGYYGVYAAITDATNGTVLLATNRFTVSPYFNQFFWAQSGTGVWSQAENWTNETGLVVAPFRNGQVDYVLNFNGSESCTASNDLGPAFQLNRLHFGGGAVTLLGDGLLFSTNGVIPPGVSSDSSGTISIGNPLALASDVTFDVSGMGITALAGVISGPGGLVKTGSGTVSMLNTNTYTGATIISDGILAMAPSSSIAAASTVIVGAGVADSSGILKLSQQINRNSLILNGGTVRAVRVDNTLVSTTLSGPISLPVMSTLDSGGSGGQITVTSGMTGAGGVAIASSQDGGGVVRFASPQSYSGETRVSGGSLTIGQRAEPVTISIGNSGFETPVQAAGGYTYFTGSSDGSWNYDWGGIARNGSPWFVPSAPQGSQAGYLQARDVWQTITCFIPGTYTVSFLSVQRTGYGPTPMQLYMDDVFLMSWTPVADSWTAYSSPTFALSAGSHTLRFRNTDGTATKCAAIDSVSISGSGLQFASLPTNTCLSIANGAVLNLALDGTNKVAELHIDGVKQLNGIYGSNLLTITGSGVLNVGDGPSVPKFAESGITVNQEAGGALLSFDTARGYAFRVVYSDTLLSTGVWNAVTPPMPEGWTNGTGELITIIDLGAACATQRFYRIESR